MVIIADSGSTKTHWAVGCKRQHGMVWRFASTIGLNPRLTNDADFNEALLQVQALVRDTEGGAPSQIYFYGAGCGTAEMQQHVKELMQPLFPGFDIFVEGDLLGACRAVCGRNPGIVGILGTGSNACLYDGERITRQVTSTGFILGDEGSGNHIGRRLVKDYLTGRMPAELSEAFGAQYPFSTNDFLQQIYHEPHANRFLASLALFANSHRAHPYIQSTLHSVFAAFWDEMVRPLAAGGDVYLVGSVAEAFQNVIAKTAPEGFRIEAVLKDPLDGMTQWQS